MLTIRPVTSDDIPALARIHAQAWRDSYDWLPDQGALGAPSETDRLQQWQRWLDIPESGVLLAIADGDVPVGFVSFGKLKTPPPGSSPIRPLYSAEIYGLYLLADYYRQGMGTALLRAAACRLREMKHGSLCLWAMEKNIRAVAFYKAMGAERCGKQVVEIGSLKAREICFGWRDLAGLLA